MLRCGWWWSYWLDWQQKKTNCQCEVTWWSSSFWFTVTLEHHQQSQVKVTYVFLTRRVVLKPLSLFFPWFPITVWHDCYECLFERKWMWLRWRETHCKWWQPSVNQPGTSLCIWTGSQWHEVARRSQITGFNCPLWVAPEAKLGLLCWIGPYVVTTLVPLRLAWEQTVI